MAAPALSIDIEGRSDKFKKSMDDIGSQADKAVSEIEAKFADFDPKLNTESYTKSITTMVAGFGVAGIVLGKVIEGVVSLNKSLADTATLAERVGLTTERIQQLKFGANVLGVGDDNFNSGLDKFASNLQNAKFIENDLTRAFEANGVAIKDNNGKLVDTSKLLNQAFDIIKRAPSIQDAIQLGGFFGFGQQLSQALFDAGDGFLKLAASANAAGAVIDDATIKKAKEFDEEWSKAAALWQTNMKAAIGGILPLLNDAVNGAVKIVDSVKTAYDFVKSIGGFAKEFVSPTDFGAESIGELNGQLTKFQTLRDRVAGGEKLNPAELFDVARFQQVPGQELPEILDSIIARINEAKKAAESANGPITSLTVNKNPSTNPGPSTSGGNSRDVFERQVDQLTKRTAQINADTTATFANHAVQQQLRAEYELLNAIVRDNGEVTQAQVDKYEELRKTMTAQQALEGAGITLTKEHGDAFFSASTKIGAATANYDAARDSLLKINSASQQFGSALSSAFADAVVEGKNLNDVLDSLIKTLEKSVINSAFASIFNAPTAGGLSPAASLFSGLFTPGAVGHNAGGTADWRGGDTWVGENGPELIRVPRGSQIAPNSAVGGGAAPVEVNIHHDGNTTSTVSQSTNSQGGPRIDVMVSNMITSALKDRGHPITRGIAQTFSLNRANGIS